MTPRWIVLFTLVLGCFSTVGTARTETLKRPLQLSGPVVRVVDGDTLDLQDGTQGRARIRLARIDTPERDQPFGKEATARLTELTAGKPLTADCYKKQHGKTPRFICRVGTGDDGLELTLVREGLAWFFEGYAKEHTADDQQRFRDAFEKAKREKRGLWSAPAVSPRQWRRGVRPTPLPTPAAAGGTQK